MKKLKKKLLKDNQKAHMTLKKFIDYFQKDLSIYTNSNRRNNAYYERRAQY